MPLYILITIGLIALYVFWALNRSGTIGGGGSQRPIKDTKKCDWSETGGGSGKLREYHCATCNMIAYSSTGAAPVDCKSRKGLT